MTSTGQAIDDDRISRISIASTAVTNIPKSDLTETKSFSNPPHAIKDVLEAVAILLGYKGTELVFTSFIFIISKYNLNHYYAKFLKFNSTSNL